MRASLRHDGFTLIELSIVLVIIGLVIGGVLVGRDLIKAAQIRQAVSQIEQVESAANAFKLKYNCLPGDCGHATDFWTVWNACPVYAVGNIVVPDGYVCNGNGNGIYDAKDERNFFWQMLFSAQLLAVNPTWSNGGSTFPGLDAPLFPFNNPFTALSGASIWSSPTGFKVTGQIYTAWPYGYIPGTRLVIADAAPGNGASDPGVPPDDARAIDIKLDDGMPFTGKVFSSAYAELPGCTDGISVYVKGTTVVQATSGCMMAIKMNF